MRNGRLHYRLSGLGVWEEKVEETGFRREVFDPLVSFLKGRGWEFRDDNPNGTLPADFAWRYQLLRHPSGLEGSLQLSGRCIALEFFQNVANVENPYGGRYDFDKLQRMPHILRKRTELTRTRVIAFLQELHSYPLDRELQSPGPGRIEGRAWIEADIRASGHFKEELGHAPFSMRENRIGGDKSVLEHGQLAWFRGRDGRLRRGVAYYRLNNQWALLSGRWTVDFVTSWSIFSAPPSNLAGRWFRGYDARDRQERAFRAAVRAMDFKRAEALKRVLFGSAKARFDENWRVVGVPEAAEA